jgi:LAO/AO transport system kinase
VFAVNKADREGADRTASTLEMMLDLGQAAPSDRIMHHGQLMEVVQNGGNTSSADDHTAPEWRPPVIKTVALHGDGVSELKEAISDHHHHLQITNELARRNRIRLTNELERILRDELMGRLLDSLDQTSLAALMERVAARELDPYTAAQQLIGGDTRA